MTVSILGVIILILGKTLHFINYTYQILISSVIARISLSVSIHVNRDFKSRSFEYPEESYCDDDKCSTIAC